MKNTDEKKKAAMELKRNYSSLVYCDSLVEQAHLALQEAMDNRMDTRATLSGAARTLLEHIEMVPTEIGASVIYDGIVITRDRKMNLVFEHDGIKIVLHGKVAK